MIILAANEDHPEEYCSMPAVRLQYACSGDSLWETTVYCTVLVRGIQYAAGGIPYVWETR